MRLLVRRLADGAVLPARAHAGDAGLDLSAAESAIVPAGGWASVGTGIALEIPAGHAALVLPRSGLAARHGIGLVNAPGLIDAGYRGEVRVLLQNGGRDDFPVEPGQRIAQLLLVSFAETEIAEVDELSASDRGEGGFGSSGA